MPHLQLVQPRFEAEWLHEARRWFASPQKMKNWRKKSKAMYRAARDFWLDGHNECKKDMRSIYSVRSCWLKGSERTNSIGAGTEAPCGGTRLAHFRKGTCPEHERKGCCKAMRNMRAKQWVLRKLPCFFPLLDALQLELALVKCFWLCSDIILSQ